MYQNRQDFELGRWPELREMVNQLVDLVYSERTLGSQLKHELFTMASVSSGCRHCQSHGAFHLNHIGVETERIQAAGQSPNAAGPQHFEELRKHYTAEQIIEILAVNCLAGWLNRWNDTVATVTDQESVDWATENLSSVGWDAGKHVGEAAEQRPGHPLNLGWVSPGKLDQ